jgi:hypothetical protein
VDAHFWQPQPPCCFAAITKGCHNSPACLPAYMHGRPFPDFAPASWAGRPQQRALPLLTLAQPAPCWPCVQRNPDLVNFAGDPLELWEHFLLLGQFQGRLHRYGACCRGTPPMACIPAKFV